MRSDEQLRFSSLVTNATSICEIMQNPEAFTGRRLKVHGIYIQDPHQRHLEDEQCPQWELNVSGSFNTEDNKAAAKIVHQAARVNPLVRIPVVYAAIFSAEVRVSGCTKRECYSYWLRDSQLLAASPQR
jgi:hypothetical protein